MHHVLVDHSGLGGELLDRFVVTYEHERDFFKFVSSIGTASGLMISSDDMLREFANGTRIVYVPSGGEPVNDMITKWSTVIVTRRKRRGKVIETPCVVTAATYAELCKLQERLAKRNAPNST